MARTRAKDTRTEGRAAGVLLRMSPAERDALRRIADRRGVTVTQYLRAKVEPELRREAQGA